MNKNRFSIACRNQVCLMVSLALSVLTAGNVSAQTPPDAGRTLQQQTPRLEVPQLGPSLNIEIPQPKETLPGGAQVVLQSVEFRGNTVFSAEQLQNAAAAELGKSYDLAGLKEVANRVASHYHEAGYPFARAFVPPQAMTGGALRIEIVEGRYGEIHAQGDTPFNAEAEAFLAPLKRSDVIESAMLERLTLILDDQPGIKAKPVIRPGKELGTGDLDVRIERTALYAGEVGFDNQGNRYTGQNRLRFNLDANSPFMLGDQISVRSLLTEEGMWFGNLAYSLPLGYSGLRGNVGYTHTYYELGKSFSSLNANGTADVESVGVSYPIIRSQRANLTLLANWQHKDLHDKQGATGTNSRKSSDSLPIGVNFDLRDGLGGGGLTYGNATWTSGSLSLDSTLKATDSTTAKTAGSFNKVNFDVARIQSIPGNLSVYGRVSAQWADKNLDSSERFGLGGPTGVRAYPVGEAYGDGGWLGQVELRYALGNFNPYAFYDAGWIKVNQNPWAAGSNDRSISGLGVGLRYQDGGINVDTVLAWRDHGGRPQSDTQDSRPRGWVTVGYKF